MSEDVSVEDFAWRTIVAGYLARDEVIDAVTAYARGSVDPGEASALVQGLWEQRLITQRRWSATTDCDRLDLAFAACADAGLLARQHYRCCVPHGFEAIVAEPDAGRYIGFVFFSEPDTANAVEGQGLFLAFGAFALAAFSQESKREHAVRAGQIAVDSLRANGLHVEWRGGIDDRIWVDLDWERRIPAGWFEEAG